MSLLEDVFLQDEANEAEELERVIEGDEFEERRQSDSNENSEKEDEAEEDRKRVDPTKTKTTRVVKNPKFLLNPARLTGPRGIQVIPEHFKDFKFKGKGYEKEDLDLVLKRLEHWAYRLYPKFQFEDCLKKIETLGKKRPVAVHLHKIRSDQFLSEDTVVQKDSSDEDTPKPVQEEDEFDKLLQQQIELARSTPAPNSAKEPAFDRSSSPMGNRITLLMMPKATSSPSINDEQRDRMLRSRKLAEERRLARLKKAANTDSAKVISDLVSKNKYPTDYNVENGVSSIEHSEGVNNDTREMVIRKKHNRSNVIDSSDEETVVETRLSVDVDVHKRNNNESYVAQDEKCTYNVIDTNSHTDAIENDTGRSEKSIFNSDLKVDEGNASVTDNKETIEEEGGYIGENNTSEINSGQDVNFNSDDKVSEKSDEYEELRYDSDENISLNEHNGSVESNENIIEENRRVLNVVDDTEKTLDKEALYPSGDIVESHKSDSISGEVIQDKENDKINFVAEEVIEDFMDVDFSDDF